MNWPDSFQNNKKVEGVKGTTTIGVTIKNGVILGADKRAAAGHVIASKTAEKIKPVTDKVGITISGSVAGAQILHKWLRSEVARLSIDSERAPTVSSVANLTATILHSNFRQLLPFQVHFLIGGIEKGTGKLFFLDHTGSLQQDKYIASGSGSPIALGMLERTYQKGLTKEEGIKLALDAVSTAINRDVYTGNGMDIATIDKEGFNLLSTEELKKYAEEIDLIVKSS